MGMLFSLSVEIIQFIVNVGSFDIDDIILNTLGCIMGYIMFLLADAVILKFKKMRR
jgi:vanZ family protein